MADDGFPSLAEAAAAPAPKKGPPPPKQKKKQEKLALSEFLGDAPASGSWADEMDALPTGPSARQEMGVGSGQLGGGFSRLGYGGGDRAGAPPREEVPLPDAPPFTAFVGNLSFEITETEISEFFGGENVVSSVRIVIDNFDNKPKGFGYVEFKTRDDLQHSLGASGSMLGARPVRVTVAEPPRRSGFADRSGGDRMGGDARRGMFDDSGRDEGRSMGDWTRSGPLPPLEGQRGPPPPSRMTANRSSSSDREPMADVDWSSARGGRFQPAPERVPSFGNAPMRTERAASFERAPEAVSKADEVSQWRRPSTGPSQSNSPLGGASPATSTPASPAMTRRRLELAPRSVSASSSQGDSPSSASSSKPSPFGNAAPVNTAERERQIEEKLAASRSSVREPASRSVSGTDLNAPRSPLPRSTSGARVDPFGAAKPTDTSAREKEVEEKRERQASTDSSSAATGGSETNKKPAQSLRKEGFSYSKMASSTPLPPQNGAASPTLPTNQFEALAIEEAAEE